MANGINKQIIVGNLARDAELVYVGDKQTAKCGFRVIANTGFGEHEHAEGFSCLLWGKRAEGLAPYLTRGKRVYVEGETRTRSWQGEDGQRRYRTEVVASEIVLLGNSNGQRDGRHAKPSAAYEEPSPPWEGEAPIPF